MRNLLAAAALAVSACAAPVPRASAVRLARPLRALTLNVRLDGTGRHGPLADLIRRADADVVFLQECGREACSAPLAAALGLHLVQQGGGTALLSRWPLEETGSGAARARLPDGRGVRLLSVHLSHAPYQPYQLLGIPYEGGRFISTEAEAQAEARTARGAGTAEALAALEDGEDAAVLAAGDFNEPSHLDWTAAAERDGTHPLKVEWPATRAFAAAGFVDAYRRVHPSETARPGFTWTPGLRAGDPKDHRDRIDFVFYRGALRPLTAEVVGEDAEHADVVVSPYPTDHRGVLVTFAAPEPEVAGLER